jgi:acetylornithine deacetylase/succinyl-diaminopimelate desuccinylase-like protein
VILRFPRKANPKQATGLVAGQSRSPSLFRLFYPIILVMMVAALIALQVLASEKLDSRHTVIAAAPSVLNRVAAHTSPASNAIPPAHLKRYQDLAVRWMQEYLRIDTTNPPGNEVHAAEWFKKIFDAEGIENRLFIYAPGRANLWARIPALRVVNGKRVDGASKRPIILLNHMDVVSSDPRHWRVSPFSGSIVEGAVYGRGAQDMKNEGLAQLLVMVMLKRERPALDRDVIFLATADEEVKDTGTDWMIAHHRELLGNAEFLLTEGGENLLEDGMMQHVGVSVAEKAPFWLHVVAHGRPGHGSRPIDDSAPNRLVRALGRILEYRPTLRVDPIVEELLRQMAPFQPPARAARFRNIRQALREKSFRELAETDDSLNYLLRDTIQITMLSGSRQTNVIPDEAWANLDVRLLPGQDPKEFLASLQTVVNDPNVTIEPLDGFAMGNSSPIDTELFESIRRVAAHYFPGAPVMPRLASGYNESQRYRPLGIVCYGFSPYASTMEEGNTQHGDNERIRVEELRRGFRILYDVVMGVAGAQ